jgi:hypothetical protein
MLRRKSEVFQRFQDFQNLVERMFNRKIVAMQTDWGGEYQKLNTFFQRVGISHHVSCPYAHQQNGSAERKHRHIVEVVLSLLAHASMPLKFWDEAFITATYLINRLPSRSSTIKHRLNGFCIKNLIILSLGPLVVHAGLICGPIIPINFNSDPNAVSS